MVGIHCLPPKESTVIQLCGCCCPKWDACSVLHGVSCWLNLHDRGVAYAQPECSQTLLKLHDQCHSLCTGLQVSTCLQVRGHGVAWYVLDATGDHVWCDCMHFAPCMLIWLSPQNMVRHAYFLRHMWVAGAAICDVMPAESPATLHSSELVGTQQLAHIHMYIHTVLAGLHA